MSGAIIRVKHKSGYTAIPSTTLRDFRLSLDALGLLVRLLSRPDDWQVQFGPLQRESRVGRDLLRRILRELQDLGYLKRKKTRDHRGRWVWESVVYDEPVDGLSVDGSTGGGVSTDDSGVDKPNDHDLSNLPTTNPHINESPTSNPSANSGSSENEISSIPVPKCLENRADKARKVLLAANPEDVSNIVAHVDHQVQLGLDGKRDRIHSPLSYLKEICERSSRGEYVRDCDHESVSSQAPEKKKFISLNSERLQLLSLLSGMKEHGLPGDVEAAEKRLREIGREMRDLVKEWGEDIVPESLRKEVRGKNAWVGDHVFPGNFQKK